MFIFREWSTIIPLRYSLAVIPYLQFYSAGSLFEEYTKVPMKIQQFFVGINRNISFSAIS